MFYLYIILAIVAIIAIVALSAQEIRAYSADMAEAKAKEKRRALQSRIGRGGAEDRR